MPLSYNCLFVKITKMIISLIGFMGCGKSSVGRRLSQLLCCRFIDLDEVVEARAGKSVSKIFEEDGEAAFRTLETQTLKDILNTEHKRQCAPCEVGRGKEIPMPPVCASRIHPLAGGGMSSPSHLPHASAKQTTDILSQKIFEGDTAVVLALGGGTVMTEECAELVRKNTCCIYLRASIDTLLERLSSNTSNRPLLTRDPHAALQGAQRRGNPLQERIAELLEQRASTYEKTANIIIDTDGKSIEQICLGFLS